MKNLFKIFSMLSLLSLSACTDYVQQMKDDHDEWEKERDKYADRNSSSSSVEAVDPSTVKMGSLYDSRDDRKYQTVTIGSQTWMAENLNYEADGSYCYQEWDLDYCNQYGRLYTWASAVAKKEYECGPAGADCDLPSLVRGVCPKGWRLPTTDDFKTLFDAVGGMDVAGRMLKSTSEWSGNDNQDSYGFGVLPGGMMMSLSSYDFMGIYAFYWTSTVEMFGAASSITFDGYDDKVSINDVDYRGHGYSIRCIEGETGEDYPESSSSDEFGSSSSSANEGYSSAVSDVSGNCGDMWCAKNREYRVTTGLDDGEDYSGFWYDFNDHEDGGASRIEWPVDKGNEYSDEAFDPIIDDCGGVCGEVWLDQGMLTMNPYVGVGFNVAGRHDVTADASIWNGVCVVYSSDVNVRLEMSLSADVNTYLDGDLPFVTLPKAPSGKVQDFAWSDFKQAGWGSGTVSGQVAAENLVALKFIIQDKTGITGNFNIISIGRYGSCY